jgi:hypothetical protein
VTLLRERVADRRAAAASRLGRSWRFRGGLSSGPSASTALITRPPLQKVLNDLLQVRHSNDAQSLTDLILAKPTNAALIQFEALQPAEQRLVRAELTARAEDRQQGRVLAVLVAAATLVVGFLGLTFNVAFTAHGAAVSWEGPARIIGTLGLVLLASYVGIWIRIEYFDSRALRARAMLESRKA